MKAILILITFLLCACAVANDSVNSNSQENLDADMLLLDTQLFSSFNKCDVSAELLKHAAMFSETVEFYHDNGGVTWNRDTMIKNTKLNVCGNFYRELLPESFKAFPIKDFGAITQGTHIFCSFETKVCEGKADFTMVWQFTPTQKIVTRVLSYGHRPNTLFSSVD